MKNQNLIQRLAMLAIIFGITFNLSAQNDLTIRGYVFSNNAPLPGWPVSILNLPGTPSFSDTVYTDNQGFYTGSVPGGILSPNHQWVVSVYDQCSGIIVSDTVTNCNGNNSTVTLDGMLVRTDTAFHSCITSYAHPVQDTSASWTLSNWTPMPVSLSYTVTPLSVSVTNHSFSKQELCSFCSQSCYFNNIYNDTQTTAFIRKFYDSATGMLYIAAFTSNNVPIFMKVDSSGNVVWAKQYNVTCTNPGYIEKALNGDFILTGTGSTTFYIMRLDASGNVLWAKNYSTTGRDWFPIVVRSAGDSYIVASWHSAGGASDDAALMRIDGNGNVLWTNRFDNADDEIIHAVPDGNGGCLFTGRTINAGVSFKMFIGDIDSSGVLSWLKLANGVNAEQGWGITKTLDGGYAVNGRCGRSANQFQSVFILKLDSLLNVSWLRKIDVDNFNNVNMPSPVIEDKYGSFYIPANASLPNGSVQGEVIKYDANGNYLWTKVVDFISDGSASSFTMVNTNGTPDDIILLGAAAHHPAGTGAPCSPGFTVLNTCNQPCNAAFSYTVSGTTVAFSNSSLGANLTYNWTFGDSSFSIQTSPTHLYPQTGTYNACLIISGSSGCVDTSCVSIITGSSACSAGFTYVVNGNTVSFSNTSVNASAYQWDFGDSTTSTSANPSHTFAYGTFDVCLVTSNISGCSDTNCTSFSFIPCSVLAAATGVATDSIIDCSGDSVQLIAFGGLSYAWSPFTGLSTAVLANPMAAPTVNTAYTVTIHYSPGCPDTSYTVHVFVDNDCVWPGDANDDGIANNTDLLAVGIGYGINGFARPNASITWTGQPSPDWMLQLAGGANLKHVDCDGSALIDSSDVPVILVNYNYTHLKGESPGRALNPDLYVEFPPDTFDTGDTVTGVLYFGRQTAPINNVYGIAFTLTYDQNIVKANTFSIDFVDSWLAPNGNRISLTKDFYADSKIDAAVSRINHTNASGFGKIANVSFVIQDNIDGKDYRTLPLAIQFENITGIDKNELVLNLTANGDTVFVKDEVDGISEPDRNKHVQIFPNPAADEISIVADFAITEITILDLAGKTVYRETISSAVRSLNMDVSALQTGSYFIRLMNKDSYTVSKKVVILK